jgi:hypothetical protein
MTTSVGMSRFPELNDDDGSSQLHCTLCFVEKKGNTPDKVSLFAGFLKEKAFRKREGTGY